MWHELIENRKVRDSVIISENVLIPNPEKIANFSAFFQFLFRAKARRAFPGISFYQNLGLAISLLLRL
jgi:hypothetical protein